MEFRLETAAGAMIFATLFSLADSAQAANDFYRAPAELPDDNGALIRQEPTALARIHIGDKPLFLDGRATRIMYRSTDDAGQPEAVTGTYIEPNTPWRGTGPRPLVSFSVGTHGVGDACVPSKLMATGLNVEGDKFMVGYELLAMNGFISRGIPVVVTDYIGMGPEHRVHTYIHRGDEGRAILDAARAVAQLPESEVNQLTPIGFFGYSQGGTGAGAAAELAASYAPELNVKGAYVGAPVADLNEMFRVMDSSLINGAPAWTVNALLEYYPALQEQFDEILNEDGQRWVEDSREQCIGNAILGSGFRGTTQFTRSGQSLYQSMQSYPDILAALEEQRLGKVAPQLPVYLVVGTHDDLVGFEQAEQLTRDWCALGSDVTYKFLDQPIDSAGVGLDHFYPILSEAGGAQDWLIKRLQGEPAQSNCATL